MALPGMKSTADFVADERVRDWRSGILLLSPRNNSPLFALTSAMPSERTIDPEFKWWEESVNLFNYTLSANIDAVVTTIPLSSGGLKLKQGDMLRFSLTGEAIRVVAVISDTSITVQRAMGAGGSAAGTAAAVAIASNPRLLYIGSAYREGAPKAVGTDDNPVQKSNVTQIFRTPIELTRTATETSSYRTGDPWKNSRRRALNKHSIGIERAMWIGSRLETTEAGQPLRFTDGILNFIPNSNIKTLTPGGVNMDELESHMAGIFAFGSREKVVWGSIKSMILINTIVRKNSIYNWGPNEKEYGMDVKRLYGPAGTLTFMEHPLFGQAGDFLSEDLVVMDTAMLKYRYLHDTELLKDRQDKGVDGMSEEYLTECGLEVRHPNTFYWLKGLKAAAKDL
jgi:hypothetical protein